MTNKIRWWFLNKNIRNTCIVFKEIIRQREREKERQLKKQQLLETTNDHAAGVFLVPILWEGSRYCLIYLFRLLVQSITQTWT